ncbi:MAG: ThiF family adenylyltransferase [Candidatus Hydrogenedentes bacterium]|nr:ThiF family adenylyltransferase [Candidatus Hydrogenedentota bacterium]
MFTLSDTPLDPAALRASVRNVEAGGFVSFEGWVRNHNEGRTVERLEYEAYPAVCLSEGNAILAEAARRFGLLEARCVHRTGNLGLEDMAVWVGVCSAHRGEAFDACRYIIDAVKHRLPIWKKEYYTDGDSGWVNCERCAGAGRGHAHEHAHDHPPALAEAAYYARQLQLREVGAAGQQKLRDARVLVVGAGGLGSPALQYLAAAGVGALGIAENDTLDASNLHRQILFDADGVGREKAELAARRLRALNPFIQVRAHPVRLAADNVESIVRDYDVIVDGSDNFETKFLLNDAAVIHRKVLVQASIYQFEGQLFVYDPDPGGPCLRCLWPEMPSPGCIGNCAEAGVIGAVPGVFGALQAMETLKHLLDLPRNPAGDTLFFDLLTLGAHRVRGARNPACPVCGGAPSIRTLASEAPVEIDAAELGEALRVYTLVDIREEDEAADSLPNGALHLPASTIQIGALRPDPAAPWVLCCTRGVRSRYLAMALRQAGHTGVYSLKGGAAALCAAGARRPGRDV